MIFLPSTIGQGQQNAFSCRQEKPNDFPMFAKPLFFLQGEPLQRNNFIRDPGVNVSANQSWHNFIEYRLKKAMSVYYAAEKK